MEINKIVEYVAKAHNLRPEHFKSKSLVKYVIQPKHTLIYILKQYGVSYDDIKDVTDVSKKKLREIVCAVKKKMKDEDFSNHITSLMDGIDRGTPAFSRNFDQDLDKLLSKCEKIGHCYVISTMRINKLSIATKYGMFTANRLYYLLTTGKRPGKWPEKGSRMRPTCCTPNCINHWVVETSEECTTVEVEMDENIDEVVYSPTEKLIIAIVSSAIAEKDVEYFKSETFDKHLSILGVMNRRQILDKLPKWVV